MIRGSDCSRTASDALRSFALAGPPVLLAVGADFLWSTNLRGLLFVLVGTAALLPAGFAPRDIAGAFRSARGGMTDNLKSARPSRVLESIARNAFSLGVLATLIGAVQLVQSFNGPPTQFLALVASAASPTFYGMTLAALFGVASAALGRRKEGIDLAQERPEKVEGAPRPRFLPERWLGHLIMAALLVWMIVPPGGSLGLLSWLDSWPAWLMVLGGTLFLALVYGRAGTGDGLTLGFSFSGACAATWALLQTLGAFSSNSIPRIASAMGGITTSWFVCLAGLLLVAFPLSDRASSAREPSPLVRAAWYLVPLLVLVFLTITILLVVTPIEKQASAAQILGSGLFSLPGEGAVQPLQG